MSNCCYNTSSCLRIARVATTRTTYTVMNHHVSQRIQQMNRITPRCCRPRNFISATNTTSTNNISSKRYTKIIRYQQQSSAAAAAATVESYAVGSSPSFVVPPQPVVVQVSSSTTTTTSPIRIATTNVQSQSQSPQITTTTIKANTATADITAASTTADVSCAAAVAAAVATTQSQSTTTMSSLTEKVAMSDLRALFIASSIPMIGFGFMDQFVLIQAGGYIDATFGVRFGLATLSAAAAGQVVSDVSGVVFGGALERLLTTNTSWLRTPNISSTQRRLPICRNVSMAGAIVGVIIGCALGATSLLFVDLEARNRMERAQRLREIVHDMTFLSSTQQQQQQQETHDTTTFPCASCTVYVISSKDLTLPKDERDVTKWKVQLKDMSNMNEEFNIGRDCDESTKAVHQCITSRSIVLSADRRVMYAPVIPTKSSSNNTTTTTKSNDDIVAVVAFRYDDDISDTSINHHSTENDNSSSSSTDETTEGYGYNEENIVTARVMARHIAIFMDR